jgi:hypothetical protein
MVGVNALIPRKSISGQKMSTIRIAIPLLSPGRQLWRLGWGERVLIIVADLAPAAVTAVLWVLEAEGIKCNGSSSLGPAWPGTRSFTP